MADDAIVMRQGDTLPALEVTLTNDKGEAEDLTDSNVNVRATGLDGIVVWERGATVDPDQSAHRGWITYEWAEDDTSGPFEGTIEFPVIFPDTQQRTYPTGGGLPFTVAAPGRLDFDPFVVDLDKVARRCGLTLPITDTQRMDLVDVVTDLQTEVEGYLRRPISPRRFTELVRNDWRDPYGWWTEKDPVSEVIETVDLGSGWTRLTYIAGLIGRDEPKITAYLLGAAPAKYRQAGGSRRVVSMSVEGQSLRYEEYARAGEPGGPPLLKSLSSLKRRTVFSRPRYSAAPPAGYALGAVEMGGTYDVGGFVGSSVTGEQWQS